MEKEIEIPKPNAFVPPSPQSIQTGIKEVKRTKKPTKHKVPPINLLNVNLFLNFILMNQLY